LEIHKRLGKGHDEKCLSFNILSKERISLSIIDIDIDINIVIVIDIGVDS
jgi:hypothetical protein